MTPSRGFATRAAHPATMTHASMEGASRRDAGIHEVLLRLSVWIESIEVLKKDLVRALDRVEEVVCQGA